jgi:hypothetical protein
MSKAITALKKSILRRDRRFLPRRKERSKIELKIPFEMQS